MNLHKFARQSAMRLLRWSLNADNHDMASNGEAWFAGKIAPRLKHAVDVGYNHGLYSEMLISHNRDVRILAFEPVEEFNQRAGRQDPDNVDLKSIALGETETRIDLYKKGGGANASPEKAGGKDFRHLTLDTRRGDSVVVETGFGPVDHIKVDTDGYDMAILRGFSKTIDASRPTIQFEFSKYWINTGFRLKDAYEFFAPRKYQVAVLHPSKLDFLPYSAKLEVYAFNVNMIALPEERSGEFA